MQQPQLAAALLMTARSGCLTLSIWRGAPALLCGGPGDRPFQQRPTENLREPHLPGQGSSEP